MYNFADLSLLHQIDTLANKSGLCAVSCEPKPLVLACPGIHKGQASVTRHSSRSSLLWLSAGEAAATHAAAHNNLLSFVIAFHRLVVSRAPPSPVSCCVVVVVAQVRVERYEVNKTRFIAAHEGNLACLAMSADGSKIATASEKGTIVRVFDTNEGSQLFELRRGTDHALVHSLSFSPACEWLAATSDKGTAHVFSLTAKPQGQAGGSGVQQAGAGAPGGVQDGAAGPAGGQGDPGRPVSAGQGRPQSGKGAVKLAQSSVKFVVRAHSSSTLPRMQLPFRRPFRRLLPLMTFATILPPAARLPPEIPTHVLQQHVVACTVPSARRRRAIHRGEH